MKLTTLLIALMFAGQVSAQEPSVSPTLKAQVLLDRAYFAVGEIDGVAGSSTAAAVKFFQQNNDLPETGELDLETLSALEDGQPILQQYTLTADDVAGPFGGRPKYANVEEKLGERFQTSPTLIKTLNPDATFVEGETLTVPAVNEPLEKNSITKLVVSTGEKSLKAYDSTGQLLAYYPVTLGDDASIPYGSHRLVGTTKNPYYRRVLRPSGKVRAMSGGPNNYVGDIWMAMSVKHYGLHGSPEPAKIAKQESAGCIRLTNWDAHEVAAAIVKNVTIVVQQ